MRLDRLLAIVIKLLSHKRLTTTQLAQEFGVSTRTIFRDLQTISLSNIPLLSVQGKQGGWEIMPDFLLDRRVLTVDDIAIMLSAISGVERGISHPALKSTLDKMESLIPPSKKTDIYKKKNHIIIDSLPWDMSKSQQKSLDKLHQAIYDERVISFSYHNLKREKTKRTVEPMTLLLKGSSWYLFGYCLKKNDYRLFRLSRLSDLEIKKETFIRRKREVQSLKDDSNRPQKTVKLTLQFKLDAGPAIGDMFNLEKAKYTTDHGTITVAVPEDEWVYSFLLGLGDVIKILAPKRIADIIYTRAKNISKLYS
jgi:predicted DNA-binding transcriptional regulator YafY